MTDPTALSIVQLADALESGGTTSEQVTSAFLDRIAAHDPDWHCYISVAADTALAAARHSDQRRAEARGLGPLDGVPLAIKDNIDVAGLPATGGIAAHRNRIARDDATCVAKLRQAGAVILGKLNMHEGALGATTDNPTFGRCENPRHPGRTPGGSSGGSGAAVAGRLCTAALGTDTMGSVRIPAAYCGVYGLKPTRDLVSTRGMELLSFSLDHIGPLGRCLDDLALLTAVIAGDFAGSQGWPGPAGWSCVIRQRPLAGLRLGRPDFVDRVGCEPGVLDVYAATLTALVRAGAEIVPMALPDIDPGQVRRAALLQVEADGSAIHGAAMARDPDGFSPEFTRLLAFGRDADPGKRARAAARVAAAVDRFNASIAALGLDAVVMPTAPQVAFPHGAPAPANQADLTCFANLTGRPAVSLPAGLDVDGLSVGLQFVGHPWGESDLLSLAVAYERERDRKAA